MPMEYVFTGVQLVCVYFSVFCVMFLFADSLGYVKNKVDTVPNLRSIASRNLYYVGEYSNKTTVSLKYWITSIEVAVYHKNPEINLIDTLRSWNKNYNYDPKDFIITGIEEAHTCFLEALDKAREEKVQPNFKIDGSYDFHVLPLSFYYNDYFKPQELLSIVDKIIGGDC